MDKLSLAHARNYLGPLPADRMAIILDAANAIHVGLHGGEALFGDVVSCEEHLRPEHREILDVVTMYSGEFIPFIDGNRRGVRVGGQIIWFQHQRRQEIGRRLGGLRSKLDRVAKPLGSYPDPWE